MPRLVKGGKWTYGWVVVGADRTIVIPPPAWRKYGFQAEEAAIFVAGSRTSGGFAISTPRLTAESDAKRGGVGLRGLGCGRFGDERIVLPPEIPVAPGARLLAVLGSCYGLSFIVRGPIYEEAIRHPELEVFAEVAARRDAVAVGSQPGRRGVEAVVGGRDVPVGVQPHAQPVAYLAFLPQRGGDD